MKNLLIKTLSLSFISLVNLYSLECNAQHSPVSDPENKDKWILNETLSDEFNGTTLDKSKWWILGENGDYRKKWKGRAPAQFVDHNVAVENGNLILTSQWEPEFEFIKGQKNNGVFYGGTKEKADNSKPITQACIMSESFFKYGYMEIRSKAANAPVTSSFWTTGYHSEIDMTENFGKLSAENPYNKPEQLERKYRTNLISWDPQKAKDHKHYKVEDVLDVRVADDYHVYGFEWDKDYIKIYFDGKLLRISTREELEEKDQWRHQFPQELWINSEVFEWYGLPNKEDLEQPADYLIDYVRIWQKEITPPNFNALGFEGPFYFQGRSMNWWAPNKDHWRMTDDKAASGDLSLCFNYEGDFSDKNYNIFAPYGSLDLPKGSNEVEFKVWIDKDTDIKKIDLILTNPTTNISFDLSNVKKGKWVKVSQKFTRNKDSVQDLKNGDRVQIQLKGNTITSKKALLYIDDIEFKHNKGLAK
ncbi:family 16 glycosylhydrolase [Flammeovirga kamogawensis]|uniref:Family 16 glycosylhydrolase n=1 Tax=Flammeovirga kamogawensis TaxID=373891 RepID=A0ABX8H387_9BACT|nr:family 16 glycosylhydrolase [Flammeovirga kamogawensis]MBB6463147.1 beta-glucanase (GH16 family) [Flammeovirga kamogawensis]QWG10381.1 family 16 glycosylhydrolase [Flammeovirga kamogawensis]